MYNREPVFLIDLKYGLNSEPASSYDVPFDQDIFEAVFASANTIRYSRSCREKHKEGIGKTET